MNIHEITKSDYTFTGRVSYKFLLNKGVFFNQQKADKNKKGREKYPTCWDYFILLFRFSRDYLV
jgi:hypothetical protein